MTTISETNTELHIGLYCKRSSKNTDFIFVAGKDLDKQLDLDSSSKENTKLVYDLVQVVKVPKKYQNIFLRLLNEKQRFAFGEIKYRYNENDFVTKFYYPKEGLRFDTSKTGLGYFLEMLTVNHLRKLNAETIVQRRDDCSFARQRQLDKIGIKPNKSYQLQTWQRAMGKGVRQAKRLI